MVTYRTRWNSVFWMETSLRRTSRMRSFSSLVNVSHATLISTELIGSGLVDAELSKELLFERPLDENWQPNNRMNEFFFDYFFNSIDACCLLFPFFFFNFPFLFLFPSILDLNQEVDGLKEPDTSIHSPFNYDLLY